MKWNLIRTQLILGFLVWICEASTAQILTIIDQQTDEPVDLASLYSPDLNLFLTTNALGQVEISAMSIAEIIEIRHLGYETVKTTFGALRQLGFIVLLEPSDVFLDDVVISATRWSQRSREVPGHIATIGVRDFALQNPQTAAELLAKSGEVFIQKSQQGGGSPMIRGFATNRLLYSVDGVRMNTAIFRSGNIQNVISLDPFAIRRTEIFFGPGSVIYGSDAIGGVMSFTTLRPELSLTDETQIGGVVAGRYASANNEKTVHLDVNTGWRKWALLSSFTSNDFGDLRMGSDGPEAYLRPWYVQRADGKDHVITNSDPQVQRPTGYQQINMMQKIRYTPSEEWDIELGLQYSATTDFARYDRLLRTRNGLPRSAEWSYGPQKWLMTLLSVTHRSHTRMYDQLSLRLAYQYFGESRIDRDFNDETRYHRTEAVDAYSGNIDFQKAFSGGHRFFYGLEFVLDEVDSRGADEHLLTGEIATGSSRYPQSTWISYAAYASYQRRISGQWLAQAGLRYNGFSLDADFSNNLLFYPLPFQTAEIQNGGITGSLGAVFTPDEALTLSVNFSTGFRAPNVDDVGKIFDSSPGSVIVPNPDLEAEYAYNAEVGLAKVFGSRLRIDLTGYYTILDHALVRRNYTLNGQDSILYDGELSQVQAIQNAATATVAGLQAGIEIKLGAGFSLLSRFNWQDGEEELDDGTTSPLRHAAPWFGVTRLTYQMKGLEMQCYAEYQGEVSFENLSEDSKGTPYIFAVDADGNPYAPSWMTLNFKVHVPLGDHLFVTGGVENILDKRYRPYSSGLSAAGRNVILAVRAKF